MAETENNVSSLADTMLTKQHALAVRCDRLRSVGAMVRSLVHELNQPLSGIRAYAENILISKERGWALSDDDVMEQMQQMIALTERMNGMITHIRDFTETVNQPMVRKVMVKNVIADAMMVIGAQMRLHDISVSTTVASESLAVKANPFVLEDVLLNILHNASEAFPNGGQQQTSASPPSVTIAAYPEKDPNTGASRVALDVTDTGQGISDDVLPHVFEAFYSTKTADEGMGLGLSVSLAEIRSLGGELTLSSKVKQGTTVRIVLPAWQDQEDMPDA